MISSGGERRKAQKYRVKLPCFLWRLDPIGQEKVVAETIDVSREGFFCVANDDSLWNVGAEIECAMELPVVPTAQRVVTMHGRGRITRVIPGENGKVGLEASAQFRLDVRAAPKQAA